MAGECTVVETLLTVRFQHVFACCVLHRHHESANRHGRWGAERHVRVPEQPSSVKSKTCEPLARLAGAPRERSDAIPVSKAFPIRIRKYLDTANIPRSVVSEDGEIERASGILG